MDTSKRKRGKGRKRGPLSEQEKAARRAAREAKLKGAKMRTPKEFSEALGVGINQLYAALERGQIKGAGRDRSNSQRRNSQRRLKNAKAPDSGPRPRQAFPEESR